MEEYSASFSSLKEWSSQCVVEELTGMHCALTTAPSNTVLDELECLSSALEAEWDQMPAARLQHNTVESLHGGCYSSILMPIVLEQDVKQLDIIFMSGCPHTVGHVVYFISCFPASNFTHYLLMSK